MKILFIANRADVFSGGQISLLELISRLDKERFEPVVLSPGEGTLSRKAETMGASAISWEMPSARTLNIGRVLRAVRNLRSIIQDQGIDIVHTNGSRAQFYASLAVKKTKASLVWHVRESIGDVPLYDWFLARSADRIICVSDGVMEKRLESCSCVLEKAQVIYNGVDAEKFRPDAGERNAVREKLGMGEKRLLGIVGLLVPLKGHLFLLKAMKGVVRRHPDVQLLVLGKTLDETYTNWLKKMTRELGIESNVLFKEPAEHIRGILSALDIFILPSRREGFSRILLEAMACELPIITTDVPGNNEAIVDGQTGLLVPYGDKKTLEKAICHFLDEPYKGKLMGENARKRAEGLFSIERHVSQVEKLYDKMKGQDSCG